MPWPPSARRPDHRAGDTAGADAARTPDTPDADDTVDTDVAVVGAGPAGWRSA